MSEPYKLHVRLANGAEFNGEGPKADVREDYREFLGAQSSQARSLFSGKPGNGTPAAAVGSSEPLDPAIIQRVFSFDANTGAVSLRILPRTERRDADALILLLYGYRALANQPDVNSGDLMKAARQSGLQLSRIDYPIAAHQQLITEGGLRRGKRYGINNQGVNHAEQLIRDLQ